jgi:hypothetical protein
MISIHPNIDLFIEQQIPSFYRDEEFGGPLLIEFLKQYYVWLQSEDNIGYKTRKLLEYGDLDLTTTDLLERVKNKYIADIPFSPDTNTTTKKILIKNALDFYRNKGNERSYDILFRSLFDKDVSIYLPSKDILRVSDGEWYAPNYLEVSLTNDLNNYVGKKIIGIGSNATAIVEDYHQILINNKVIEVLTLSNAKGFFLTGEYIRIFGSDTIDDLPKILGSLTAVNVIDGGANFEIGDIVDITGKGKNAKGRVVETQSSVGKISFKLIFPGSGYSRDTIPLVQPRIILSTSSTSGYIRAGQFIYQTDNIANGEIYETGPNSITLKQISSGFKIQSNIKTAIQLTTTKLANNINNFSIGEVITQYYGATQIANGIISSFKTGVSNTIIYVTDVLGQFNTSYYTNSVANNTIVSSNTHVKGFVYAISGGPNTGSATITDIDGGGEDASFRIGDIYDTEFITVNRNYLRDIAQFSITSFDGVRNTYNTVINEALNYETIEIGSIQYLKAVVPGKGYSLDPFVTLIYYPVASMRINDIGGFKGNNALVTATAGIADGIATVVEVIDSGYGYEQGEYLTLQKTGSNYSITGRAIVLKQGKKSGYWKSTRGFLSDDKKIQDSKYYQEYSYEIQSDINYERYNNIVRTLVHPIGTEMFGKFLLTSNRLEDESIAINSQLQLSGNGTVTVVNTTTVNVIGINTSFTTFFTKGDLIRINGDERTVNSISNNTLLIIDNSFGNSYTSNTYSKIKIN